MTSTLSPARRIASGIVAVVAFAVGVVVPAQAASAATAATVTATAPAYVAYSKSATVTGTVSLSAKPVTGATVRIEKSQGSGWVTVASTVTNASGAYSASFTPLLATTFRAEAVAGGGSAGGVSAPLTVGVQPQIYDTTVSGSGSDPVGATRVFSGAVHAGLAGRRIKVEAFEPSAWGQVGTSYVKSDGTFAIPVKTTHFGNQAFRVVMPSGDGLIVKAVGPFDVGSYGGAAAKLSSAVACFGAAALPGSCSDASLGTSIAPAIAGAKYASDTQGAFSCYTSDVKTVVPMCSEGSTRGDALRVAVTGDSHGAMLLAGLRPYLTALNWRLDSYVAQGCVLAAVPASTDPCHKREVDLNARLQKAKYDVLLVTSWRGNPLKDGAVDPRVAGYADSWKTLVAGGTKIVAVADGPTFPQATLDCVNQAKTYTATAACQATRAQAFGVADPLVGAVEATPGATLVDETDHVCTATACSMIVGHTMAYRDTHHHSATFEKTLVPFIVEDAAKSF